MGARRYDSAQVLDGLFKLIDRLFGVTVEAADGKAEVWNDDVRYFEATDSAQIKFRCDLASTVHLTHWLICAQVKDGEKVVASFYLDPYSRPEDKRGGAWMGF